jgi:hypothetical protein
VHAGQSLFGQGDGCSSGFEGLRLAPIGEIKIMSRSFLGLAVIASSVVTSALPALAADYTVRPRQERHAAPVVQIDRGRNPYCGPRCGCPIVVHVRHRSLGNAYASGFDPRTRDEPHYFYGPNRTYVRYANPNYPERVLEY